MPSKISYYYEMGRRIHPLMSAPKLWNYVKYRSLPRATTTSVRRYTPQIASLMLTKRCNLSCAYCSAGNLINRPGDGWRRGEATLERVTRIFSNPLFAGCLLVDLLGGEPLLVADLEEIVAYLVKRGHIVNMATNGLLLLAKVAGLKRAGISRINVSLYTETRQALARDLPAINRVFPVHASVVLLRSEIEKGSDALLETARFARDAGCRSLRFYGYRPMGVNPNPAEILDDALIPYVDFRKRMDKAFPGFLLWPALIRKGRTEKRCPQLWQRISCDVSGAIGICCGTDRGLQGPNGNLFDGEPDAVFNHPTLVAMREKLLDPDGAPPDICRTCNLLGEAGW